jgi:glyoxylase-like metal-dependent hydrolase (beta-lactamase superfamily II)
MGRILTVILPHAMQPVADNVWMLSLSANFVNAFVIGDVLIDAGGPWDASGLIAALAGRLIAAHAITHAHPDHMGASHAVCERFGVPFWVGEKDLAAAEDPGRMVSDFVRVPGLGLSLPRNAISDRVLGALSGPGHPVARALREADEVGGFRVLETPGHTRGHVAFWRAEDRVLIAGDVLWNYPRLMLPVPPVNVDNRAARASARRIAELEPAVACFGHGPVLRDPGRLARLAAGL